MKVPTYTSMNGEPVSLKVTKGCGSFREHAKISHLKRSWRRILRLVGWRGRCITTPEWTAPP